MQQESFGKIQAFIETNGNKSGDSYKVEATPALLAIMGEITPYDEIKAPDGPCCFVDDPTKGREWQTIKAFRQTKAEQNTLEQHAEIIWKEITSDGKSWTFSTEAMRHLRMAARSKRPEIVVDLDTDTVIVGSDVYAVGRDAALIVSKLIEENGGWVPAKQLPISGRADRLIRRLPDQVKNRIESKTGTGYRIHI